jgi:hypothetical protein
LKVGVTQEANQTKTICMMCDKAIRVNDDGIDRKGEIERYIAINYFANGKLERAEYQHWRCYARDVYLDFIEHMKSIRDNPLLNQDILSDVAKLEERVSMENKKILEWTN